MPCRRGRCTHCLLVYFREVPQECSVCPAGEETVLIVFLFISEKFHRSVVYTLEGGSCTHCVLYYFREVLQEYNVCPAGEEAVLIVCFFISEKFYRSIMYALQERKLYSLSAFLFQRSFTGV